MTIYRSTFRIGVPVVLPNPDGSPTELLPPPGQGVVTVSEVDTERGVITVSMG